ncbi:unnamed protein product [Ranitomeya imitator]|uniref:Helix-turn-helix domain-containing protein n=1 Tax=Ranitomeya imitator TaxID=111125 RepID=A0ABN9LCY2_9NEOB|nr:unnamed protein product [Ranitomeya imitator]
MSNPTPQNNLIQGWMRYIDDIWFVWEGSISELNTLMAALNHNDLNIKLTFKYGRSVDFLDLQIRALPEGDLVTNVFRKSTATNSLLHAESAHLPSTIKGIPVGQFLRVRRICSRDEDFNTQAEDLTTRFLQRGYKEKTIRRGLVRAQRTPRNTLLYSNVTRTCKEKDQVRFITGYHNKWFQFRQIIIKHWSVLQTDPVLKQILPVKPSIVAKRSRNIRDILVHSHYEPAKKNKGSSQNLMGFFPCGRCKACANCVKAKKFTNFDGSRSYEIRGFLSCASKGVIYHSTCPCGKIYIGLTTRELKIRVREHCLDITKAKAVNDITSLKTLPRHYKKFHNCDPSLMKVKAIDIVNMGTRGESFFAEPSSGSQAVMNTTVYTKVLVSKSSSLWISVESYTDNRFIWITGNEFGTL